MKYYKTSTVLVMSLFVCLVSGCFITNCPIGGKRAVGVSNVKLKALRQCSACGPRGTGRCFGPQICCGPLMGCHMNSRDTYMCQLESSYPVPCENHGTSSCGNPFDGGQCAADGVCCSTGQCNLDENCKSEHGSSRLKDYMNSATTDLLFFKDGIIHPSLTDSNIKLD